MTKQHSYLVDRGWGFTIREGRYQWTDPKIVEKGAMR